MSRNRVNEAQSKKKGERRQTPMQTKISVKGKRGTQGGEGERQTHFHDVLARNGSPAQVSIAQKAMGTRTQFRPAPVYMGWLGECPWGGKKGAKTTDLLFPQCPARSIQQEGGKESLLAHVHTGKRGKTKDDKKERKKLLTMNVS
jgi:hypothetical protein